MTDPWDPRQYELFLAEREQPGADLIEMLEPAPGGRAVDLGCGTGRLTLRLHRHLGARSTLGIDRSKTMLAGVPAEEGLRFETGDVKSWRGEGFDVVFSNAVLQWVGDYEGVLQRCREALAPGGQLAIQVPANHGHISQVVARELAARFEGRFTRPSGYSPCPEPELFAELLWRLGFEGRRVEARVYGHLLPNGGEVVEWMKGTLLTDYAARLPAGEYAAFEAGYRERIVAELGDDEPCFFPFRRVLVYGRLRGGSDE